MASAFISQPQLRPALHLPSSPAHPSHRDGSGSDDDDVDDDGDDNDDDDVDDEEEEDQEDDITTSAIVFWSTFSFSIFGKLYHTFLAHLCIF